MKKSHLVKRGVQDAGQRSSQPDKVGWVRKFCGKGIFREIWRNKFVMLKGEHLYIFEKEMKNNGKTHEIFDLAEYERSEEVRKAKSYSKKNLSMFTLLRCRHPGTRTHNLVFLAVSPEEKESWINVLNSAITRAKSHILDVVTIEEDSLLPHLTRDRAKIPLGRRLPTRGHLMAVASTSSDGMLMLDLVHEEGACMLEHDHAVWVKDQRGNLDLLAPARRRAGTDVTRLRDTIVDAKVKTSSLPRESELFWSHPSQTYTPQHEKETESLGRSYCNFMDNTISGGERKLSKKEGSCHQLLLNQSPTSQLQDMVTQRLQRTRKLLAEIQEECQNGRMGIYPPERAIDSPWLCQLKGSDSSQFKSSNSHSSFQGKSLDSQSRLKAKDSPSSKPKDSPHVIANSSSNSKSIKSSVTSKDKFSSSCNASPNSKGSPNIKCIDLKGSGSPIFARNKLPNLCGIDSASIWASSVPSFKGTKDMDFTLTEVLDWETRRAAAEQLLQEAITSWLEAREVLSEVKELQTKQKQAEQVETASASSPSKDVKQINT